MIANDVFAATFGSVPPGDEEALAAVARNAVRNGFALVLSEPGTKKPLCTLTARQAKEADRHAQEQALAAGDPNASRRRHECAVAHAITDPKAVDAVVRRMVKAHGHVNFGVEPGASRMLVVDVDTAAERDAFLAAWSAATGEDMTGRLPTVLSPGVVRVDADGEARWVHKDGGHFWFSLPEGVDLAGLAGPGILTADGGWVAIWRGKQVLVPPSVRAEGPYRLVGQVEQAGAWLLDRVMTMAQAHVERRRIQADKWANRRDNGKADPIDVWAAATPWADILGPDGWTDTGLLDTCDCPVWTRPGDGVTHHKSATAHDIGCTRYDTGGGHAPLYLWTDNPPAFLAEWVRARGTRAVLKLQYVTARDHAGDASAAMQALGIQRPAAGREDPWAGVEASRERPVVPVAEAATRTDRDRDIPTGTEVAQVPVETLVDVPIFGEDVEIDHSGVVPVSRSDFIAALGLTDSDVSTGTEVPESRSVPVEPDPVPVVPPVTVSEPDRSLGPAPEGWHDFLRELDALGLPPDWAGPIREKWVREWQAQTFASLRNVGQRDELRAAMLAAAYSLDQVELSDVQPVWRIEGLWQERQRVMMSAQRKAGKTTMVLNLIRSIVDGSAFLGRFTAAPIEGSVALVNAEMPTDQMHRWLLESGIRDQAKVKILNLRDIGKSAGDITDPVRREILAEILAGWDTHTLILDPLNPLIGAAGLEENSASDASRWYLALDDLVEMAGVKEQMIIHHMGKVGTTGRGNSKWEDTPDVLWTYERDAEELEDPGDADGPLGAVQPAGAPRWFSAFGRDVDVPRSRVDWDAGTRSLVMPEDARPVSRATQQAQRREQARTDRIDKAARRVAVEARVSPGATFTVLHQRIGGNKEEFRQACHLARDKGWVVVKPGPRQADLYHPALSDDGNG